jgi:2',3'-cyclic-nucleotide 2'-phosphodiesterase (5'-nucleotidase family)
VDSIKTSYGQVVLVDGGGFFPEDDLHQDVSWFLMDAMKVLGTDAVGMSERELRFGLAYLKAQLKRTQLPVVCANLYEKKPAKLLLAPYVLKQVGGVKVGIFGLMSNAVSLGTAQDSLRVEDPTVAAKRTVAELQKKGATVVVLLSQLGKVEGEDLVAAVDGIDAVVLGHSVPLLQKGRLIKSTVACYGGEQGQYIGRTLLTLDGRRKMTSGDNETFILGPDIPDEKGMAALVKGFNDSFNEKLQKLQKERAAKDAEKAARGAPEHYLGSEVCGRCHAAEAAQWQASKHAQAWETLVAAKQDTVAACIGCHVAGYRQAGGYQDAKSTPGMKGVQCESCHGMGSTHDAFSSTPRRVTEQTCRICHTKEASPGFDYALYLPYVSHHPAGTRQALPGSPMRKYLPAGK